MNIEGGNVVMSSILLLLLACQKDWANPQGGQRAELHTIITTAGLPNTYEMGLCEGDPENL